MAANKIQLLALDLDGTLADINQPIAPEVIALLKQIAASGVAIAILSGKPTAYLTGLARQIGIADIILSGENGAEVQFGLSYPPKAGYVLSDFQPDYAQLLADLNRRFPNQLWIQPNRVNFSVFAAPLLLPEIRLIFDGYIEQHPHLMVYSHSDCVELVDKSISKSKALDFILQQLQIDSANVCAIGDGENDVPMLEKAAVKFSIKKNLAVEEWRVFDSIAKSLEWII